MDGLMKKETRKFLAVLLALAITMGMMPESILNVQAEEAYGEMQDAGIFEEAEVSEDSILDPVNPGTADGEDGAADAEAVPPLEDDADCRYIMFADDADDRIEIRFVSGGGRGR